MKLLRTESVGVGGMEPLIGHFKKITQVQYIVYEKKNVFRGNKLGESHNTYVFWLAKSWNGWEYNIELGESVSFSPIEIVHAIGLKGRRDTNSLNTTQ